MLDSVVQSYNWLMSIADPRVIDWPLMNSPLPMLTIIATYVYTVKVAGPRFMKNRKPFDLKRYIIAYNFLMIVGSALFFHYGGQLTYIPPGGKFNLICQPIDYQMTNEALRLPRLGWWLLLFKIFEFADTIFFVLRKKYTQISMLHVIHHSLVPWGIWIGVKFGAGGQSAFFPLINLLVHIIMYTYYFLAALGPSVQKYLWWKRYLTMVQMVQFVMATIHAIIPLFYDCGYQPIFAYAIIGHGLLFWVLFYNFYQKQYNSTATTAKNSSNVLSIKKEN